MTEKTEGPGRVEVERQYKYNTIALEPDFMLKTIGFGDAIVEGNDLIGFAGEEAPDLNYLNIVPWFAWVPEAVREEVRMLASKAMTRAELSPSRSDKRIRFIAEFQQILSEKTSQLPGLKAKFERLKPETAHWQVEEKPSGEATGP